MLIRCRFLDNWKFTTLVLEAEKSLVEELERKRVCVMEGYEVEQINLLNDRKITLSTLSMKSDWCMIGQVEKYLLDQIRNNGAIHITLIDPEEATSASASRVAKEAECCETAAIMVGGSTLVSTSHLDRVVKAVKRTVDIPVILFPNNVTGISRYADAVWFMSLLNSLDAYFLMGAQVLGAPLIKNYGLEAIPLGYLVVGEGGTAGVIGRVSPIPYDKPELAAAHALAAQYFGMRFVYLEAGSGAKQPVPDIMIQTVKKFIHVPLIIGGGIRNGGQAKKIAHAGADVVVTGNIIEQSNAGEKIKELIEGIRYRRKPR